LDDPNTIEDDFEADDASDVDRCNGIKASESPEQQVVCAAPNVPGLIRPTWRSMKLPEKVLITVSAMDTRSNKGNKEKVG